jgi:hypothetical protein
MSYHEKNKLLLKIALKKLAKKDDPKPNTRQDKKHSGSARPN